jgi:Flp pilus assembly protein TadG
MSRMLHTTWNMSALSRLAADQRGVTAIITGLALTIILGFAGLAIDVSYWLNSTRGLQAGADQMAYSAASAAGNSGCTSTTAVPQALAIGAARGYAVGATATTTGNTTTATDGTTTVTITCTPSNSHFSVRVDQVQPMWFAKLFMQDAPTASAAATAQLAGKVSDVCILALDGYAEGVAGTDANAAQLGGSTAVDLGCSLAIDSTNIASLNVYGSANLTATSIYLAGDNQGSPSGSASITTAPTPNNILRNQNPVEDPYLGRTFTAPTSCTGGVTTGTIIDTNITLSPGTFCGGLKLGDHGHRTVLLEPGGVYYVVGGLLEFDSQVTVIGVGVTFILTGGTVGGTTYPYAELTINGGANLSLSAPTSGPFGGMVFFQDRAAPASTIANCGAGGAKNKINGGSDQLITGAIYFPNQSVCYNGNSATVGAGKCTQLIARSIDWTGNSSVKLDCAGTGVSAMMVPVPQLIQ